MPPVRKIKNLRNNIKRISLLGLLTLLNSCSTLTGPPIDRALLSSPGVFPVKNAAINLCEASVSDQLPRVVPPMAKPAYLQPTIDPAFGNRLVRISQSSQGTIHKPLYSTVQAWNADESLLLLFRRRPNGDGDYLLLDGHTYEAKGRVPVRPADIEEVFWSRNDPDRLFYVSSNFARENQFLSYNVATRQHGFIKDFRPMCRSGSIARAGNDVHMQSHDDDLFGFRCEAPGGGFNLMSYRISTDELNVVKAGEGNTWDNWRAPVPAPSGTSMWLHKDIIDPQFQAISRRLDMANSGEHGDVGLTHTGEDSIFQTVFDPSPAGCNGAPDKGVGHLGAHSFNKDECRGMITEAEGWPYTTSGTHVSAGAIRQPGWIALSSIGYREQLPFHSNQQPATPLFSEIYLMNTNPNTPQVCRIAHHRSFGKFATKGGYNGYFAEPHPSHSPSGTRVIFGSDWQDSGSVDAYVVELPGYIPPAR